MTHTPGPWAFDDQSSPLVYSRANGGNPYIAQVFSYSEGETGTLRTTAHADACLIAAAPDLLAACQAVLDEFPAFDNQRIESIKAICRAAIARATGI